MLFGIDIIALFAATKNIFSCQESQKTPDLFKRLSKLWKNELLAFFFLSILAPATPKSVPAPFRDKL
jgi:hypothetical protein